MEHLTLKAVTTAQDQGIFTAVISTASIDREKDIVDPAGMVAALQKWVPTGKRIPLAWNHSTSADQIIGSINPGSAKDVGGEVVVDGQIDQSTDTGAHAWRLIKSGVVGFSFGYLVLNGSKRKGGGRNITELDVFEITATPTPMNNDTRVLDFKAATDAPPSPTQTRILNSMIGQAQEYIASKPDGEDASEMADVLDSLKELLGEPATEDPADDKAVTKELSPQNADEIDETTRPRSMDPLRRKADALVLEVLSSGESLRKPPRVKQTEPAPRVSVADVRRQMYQATLDALIGGLDLE